MRSTPKKEKHMGSGRKSWACDLKQLRCELGGTQFCPIPRGEGYRAVYITTALWWYKGSLTKVGKTHQGINGQEERGRGKATRPMPVVLCLSQRGSYGNIH